MKRIGFLTSGGDCQGLNATMRGVARALYNHYGEKNIEIIGILNGYKGLIHGDYKKMKPEDFSGILSLGGTILGTSRQPFKMMRVIEEDGVDKVACMKKTYKYLKLDCLVVLGGNGSQKTANLLSEEGCNVVSLPKTIDNDLWNTDKTFGFQSGINVATYCIDAIHTTADSHNRIFVVEVMGHKVGWLTLYAGMAGGADVILLPEIPYSVESVIKKVSERERNGKHFTVIAMAEGAVPKEVAELPKKERKAVIAQQPNGTFSSQLAKQIEAATGHETRVTIPGHIQRGGDTCPYDRVLSTSFGAAAAQLIIEEKYGNMVALHGDKIVPVPLSEVAGKLKVVPVDCHEIKCARAVGIAFGDE
ncbi:MAG: 6-phosphofructokinase [Clostridia bacterium]|nr:6-phosphofructokinase [Clostridia bacterium]MEE1124697.1 ATP-dependent 6-phosphofructokinase [Acutalibacteraceae bacterium]